MKRTLLLIAACVLFLVLGPKYCGDVYKTDADKLNEGIVKICQDQRDQEKRALEYVDSIRIIAEEVEDPEVYDKLIDAADHVEYLLTEYNYEDELLELVKEVDP